MIHKRIVLGMDNQRGFGDLVEQRHSATLTVIVYSISETVDFGGDQIVKSRMRRRDFNWPRLTGSDPGYASSLREALAFNRFSR